MPLTEAIFSITETETCPHCHLRQYATVSGDSVASTKCRRCGQPLGVAYYRFQPPRVWRRGMLPDRDSVQRSIGAFIRRLRLRRHISQEALARSLAIDRTVLTRAEGGRFMNLAILLRAALALDLEIDQVFVRVRDRRARHP